MSHITYQRAILPARAATDNSDDDGCHASLFMKSCSFDQRGVIFGRMSLNGCRREGVPDAARQGTLAVMAGGAEEDIEAVWSVIADLAANLTRMGGVGAGQSTKWSTRPLLARGYVVMAEALALAECSGIDAAALPACLAGGALILVCFENSIPRCGLAPLIRPRATPASFSRI